MSGSSCCSGMSMVPLPPFWTRSRPWSKNCPKKVNQALKPADRPSSGAALGITSTCPGCTGCPASGPATWVSTPFTSSAMPASMYACSAAGLSLVWSTIRLEMVRGCESFTRAPGFPGVGA
ncbi:hypothetical protein D9M70_329360 [compost metagenome]